VIVVISAAAEADLESIGDWIARENPTRAESFIQELREACLSLANAPLGYSPVPRYEHADVRRRPHGNYLIFYRVMDDEVVVLHVLHGARDYDAVLFPDG
jgi:plasmid stabilization system protein ParE